jgi:hypothetical protein
MAFLSQVTSGTQNTIGAFNTMSGQAMPRASYAMMSFNTSSTFCGAVFYDGEFRRIGAAANLIGQNYAAGFTNDLENQNTTYVQNAGQMYNASMGPNTQTAMSTSSYSLPLCGTASMGEYGQAAAWASERGIIMSSSLRFLTQTATAPVRANRAFVNSDHANKKLTMQFSSGWLTVSPEQTPVPYAVTATDPFPRPKKNLASIFTTYDGGSQITSMYGSASYNAVRKELMVACFTSTTSGRVNIGIWKNFDFDAVVGNVATLGNPDVLLNTTLASWVNTNEGRFNSKWVLVDDGSIFVSSFNENSNNYYLWKITRATGDASLSNTLVGSQSMTTSYGVDQGEAYGQRQMQTRDGSMVCAWAVYYYYQCGMRGWVIDKRNSSWISSPTSNNTTSGSYPVKYRNNQFAFIENGNFYASNYTAAYIFGYASPSLTAGGSPDVFTTTVYFPSAPGPNTTNYPGLTHVSEFDFQSNLPY